MALSGVRYRWARLGLALIGSLAIPLAGCNGFFVRETTTGGTTGTGDYAYVSNSSTGATYINGYSVSSGTLVATTSSPYQLSFSPSSMAVAPSNNFLYIATDAALYNGAIYLYTIGTGGALSLANNSLAVASENVSSLAISPDGNWLFALDSGGLTLEEYSINTSTGVLTFATTYSVVGASGGVVTPSQIRVSPDGAYIACALGTGGTLVLPFNTTTGVASAGYVISTGSTTAGDYALTMDSSDRLYVARTTGVAVYTLSSAGATAVSGSPFNTGNGPHSILLASGTSSTFLYVGNQTDSTISEFTVGTGGVLTAVSGSPISGPAAVGSLGLDNTGKYVLAAGYNSGAGVQIYSIGSSGSLSLGGSAASGTTTTIPAVMALTH